MWAGDPDATMAVMLYIDARGDEEQRRERTGSRSSAAGRGTSDPSSARSATRLRLRARRGGKDLTYRRATVGDKVHVGATALTGPTADPSRRVRLINTPGAEVGPGQVAAWGVVSDDHAEGLGFSHTYHGGSSKHSPFDRRP